MTTPLQMAQRWQKQGMIPAPLQDLMKKLGKLPGLGPRSAQRTALHLLTTPDAMSSLQRSLLQVANTVTTCHTCGNVCLESPCHICTDPRRDDSLLCVVEQVDDLWAMERSGAFRGRYHVLGGTVNALEGISPEDLNMKSLMQRLQQPTAAAEGDILMPTEVILALSAGVDGQTTSHLLANKLESLIHVSVTQLAKGIPVGASVDYLDEGTLTVALAGRQSLAG